MTKNTSIAFTQEDQLINRYKTEIPLFWQQGIFSHFIGQQKTRVNYALFIKPANIDGSITPPRKKLIIVPGRSDAYLKYQELCYDFFQLGYDIYIIDHRGQGVSQRMLDNPFKGYVKEFDHYSQDLNYFVSKVVNTDGSLDANPPYLLAHSMGGAIAARYFQMYNSHFKAAVLSSPMIAINRGGLPMPLVKGLIYIGNKLNRLLAQQPWYFIGQKDFSSNKFNQSFANNPLMHSKIRYQLFSQLYKETAEIQLGGATITWIVEALSTHEKIFKNITDITVPTLVLQSGADTVVDNQAQNDFCQQLHNSQPQSCPGGKPVVIAGAKHELFFEKDIYRNQALLAIKAWFDQH